MNPISPAPAPGFPTFHTFNPNEPRDDHGRWTVDDAKIYEYGACVHVISEKITTELKRGNSRFKVIDGIVYVDGKAVPHTWIELPNGRVYDPTKSQFRGAKVDYHPKDEYREEYTPKEWQENNYITTHARRYEPPLKKFGVTFKKPPNPLKSDPTRTLSIRRAFTQDVNRRLKAALDGLLEQFMDWPKHKTPRQQLDELKRWIDELFDRHLYRNVTATNESWTAQYVRAAYEKGAATAYNTAVAAAGQPVVPAQRAIWIKSLNRRYEENQDMIVDQAVANLDGIGDAVRSWIVKDAGVVIRRKGKVSEIQKIIRNIFDNIVSNKAVAEVSDMVVGAHAEGQLDALEDLGVPQVAIEAEWVTARDNKVCPRCKERDGQIYSIEEARGLIPLHRRCRCAFVAVVTPKPRRQRLIASIRASKSISQRKRAGRQYEPPTRKFGVRFQR